MLFAQANIWMKKLIFNLPYNSAAFARKISGVHPKKEMDDKPTSTSAVYPKMMGGR
jgi:hypothetical protein